MRIDHVAFTVRGRVVCPVPALAEIDDDHSIEGWEIWLRSEGLEEVYWRPKLGGVRQWMPIGTVALVDGAAITFNPFEGWEDFLRDAAAVIAERSEEP